jgi:hypothetical protein
MQSNQPKKKAPLITSTVAHGSMPLVPNSNNHLLNWKLLSTPKILKRSMFALWGLSLVWVPISITAVQNQRNTIKTIAKDSVPSVLLAQRIVDAMSDMDAMVANALLQPNQKNLLIQESGVANLNLDQKNFNERRAVLAERLTKAAKNITFPGEEEAIRQLTLDFGNYLSYVERAQAAHAQGDRAKALEQYKSAMSVLDNMLIPTAYKLKEINSRELERQYSESKYVGSSATAGVFLLGAATIAGLVILQMFISIRTRRTLNPLLLAATVTAFIFLLTTLYSLIMSGEQLRIVKEDSYNSLLALRTGRSLLYAANSDESRFLLDVPNQDRHESAFFKKTSEVFGNSNNQNALTGAIQTLKMGGKNPNITGHFAKAINNITFDKERVILQQMMAQYQEYMSIDQQIRTLVDQKRSAEALELCLGQSNQVFESLKDTMDEAIKINQEVFEDVEKKATNQLAGYEVKATIALGIMATLIFFGLKPRLKEYS